jgi:hypothetical protein
MSRHFQNTLTCREEENVYRIYYGIPMTNRPTNTNGFPRPWPYNARGRVITQKAEQAMWKLWRVTFAPLSPTGEKLWTQNQCHAHKTNELMDAWHPLIYGRMSSITNLVTTSANFCLNSIKTICFNYVPYVLDLIWNHYFTTICQLDLAVQQNRTNLSKRWCERLYCTKVY